jgi:predicted HicB family RNase H-like nuclease
LVFLCFEVGPAFLTGDKLNVRLPRSLHAALASEAEAEGGSLNQLKVESVWRTPALFAS